jgi:hypothetical protein
MPFLVFLSIFIIYNQLSNAPEESYTLILNLSSAAAEVIMLVSVSAKFSELFCIVGIIDAHEVVADEYTKVNPFTVYSCPFVGLLGKSKAAIIYPVFRKSYCILLRPD